MNRNSMPGRLLIAAACLLSTPVLHAQSICTFSVSGASGDFINDLKDYQLAARNWGIKELSLKIYKSETDAVNDFKKGSCDGLAATAFGTREFNSFTSSMSAIGAVPSNAIAKAALNLLGSPKLAQDMVQGNYEVAGIIPIGAAYFVLKDRSINSLQKAEGKRGGVLEIDPTQARMLKKVGGIPVNVTYNDGITKLREGSIDMLPVPAMAFDALEVYRAMGSNGGVVRFPVSFMTAVVVINSKKFPEGFGQQGRSWMSQKANSAMTEIAAHEKAVPAQYWVHIAPDDQVAYNRLTRQMRQEFIVNKIYNPKMLRLLKKLRCQQDSSNFECALNDE